MHGHPGDVQGVLDRAPPLVAKALPVLSKAGHSISSAFSAVAAKIKPPAQSRPPHVEL